MNTPVTFWTSLWADFGSLAHTVQNKLCPDVEAASTPPAAASRSGTPRADRKAVSFDAIWLMSTLMVPDVEGFFRREISSLVSFSRDDRRPDRLDEANEASVKKREKKCYVIVSLWPAYT